MRNEIPELGWDMGDERDKIGKRDERDKQRQYYNDIVMTKCK